ncbi:hypothetical protein HanLR1_Chr14g0532911 [Helianthus annuus]|nr:hypothetical protein HanLR1_Chr14g0532911 [Helianthus annuus]
MQCFYAPALGTKRLASEDPVQDWDNKRLNAGQAYPPPGQISSSSYITPFSMASSAANQTAGLFQLYPDGTSPSVQHSQLNLQLPQIMTMPTLPEKGQSNGVMETGCALIVTITIMHLDLTAISVIHKGKL